MKKSVSIVLLLALCTAFLCSCSFPKERYLSPEITSPDTYRIIYEELKPGGTTELIGEGVDSDGNLYYLYEGTEYVYVKDPESISAFKPYNEYKNTGRGFASTADEVMGTEPYGMEFIYMYAKYNLKTVNCTMTKNANETVAGRDCYSYTIVVHQSGTTSVTEKYTYEVLIDVETGYCLKSYCVAIDSPIDDTAVPYGFVCTEFVTDPANFADLVK